MRKDLKSYVIKALRAPPRVVWFRAKQLFKIHSYRYTHQKRAQALDESRLCRLFQAININQLWSTLSEKRNLPYHTEPLDKVHLSPKHFDAILQKAELSLQRKVSLLGSKDIALGTPIAWSKDYISGFEWPKEYWSDLQYNYFEEPSDVKIPWELSRLQWLIPVGQAYLLTQNERYAIAVQKILDEWIDENPYAHSINWACTMEAALRIFVWTWLFKVFCSAPTWRNERFRVKFLSMLYLHGEFTERYLEYGSVNGNHCTADAAALCWLGLFFKTPTSAQRWARNGWSLLEKEIERQIYPDGVDFEASSAYHRLVGELFFWPAFYRDHVGLEVSTTYRERLHGMARFTQAYTKPNGLVPLWGDADDARVLPFGLQPINDHRYFFHLMGIWNTDPHLLTELPEVQSELIWICGPVFTSWMDQPPVSIPALKSQFFPQGGCGIMRGKQDHIFIDCGPVGLANRGGHGHNDCLSFEAFLKGVPVITDCGSYVYTASPIQRNRFRSTAYHNTPVIDHTEINRWTGPYDLWTVHPDATPHVLAWESTPEFDYFCGSHDGYHKLKPSVSIKRHMWFDRENNQLRIRDEFEGTGQHHIKVPLHCDPQVRLIEERENAWLIQSGPQLFLISFSFEQAEHWNKHFQEGWVSPSYGIKHRSLMLVWNYQGPAPTALDLLIQPVSFNT